MLKFIATAIPGIYETKTINFRECYYIDRYFDLEFSSS